jgi:hypothetical protein
VGAGTGPVIGGRGPPDVPAAVMAPDSFIVVFTIVMATI